MRYPTIGIFGYAQVIMVNANAEWFVVLAAMAAGTVVVAERP
ncbi:MAG TPA: hypothetical protein VLH60_07030 [Sedimentisphaerales bacterium]|nr:hypothetical protein [Sedimentisphaerales bacterium]